MLRAKTKPPAMPPVDAMFRAFSDRTRLRILNLLRGGEVCVCDLVEIIGAPQPTVSRHLAYLRKCGLVLARRDGAWMHYSLTPAADAVHAKMMECLAACAGRVPELSKDAGRLPKINCGGATPCCGEDCGGR